jgi:hypothetical protein
MAEVARLEVAGPGFLNVFLAPAWVARALGDVLGAGETYGHGEAEAGQRIRLEFVSANPTGPLVIVNARAAAVGDSLARLLRAQGARVTTEYYVNDAGNQFEALARSFEARVAWNVARPGGAPVRASEVHRVRQLPSGEFEASADIDPGLGPGSETGKQVVFVNGMTYARARPSPFRERPTDRGHDARRFRDDSFRVAADVAQLLGKALSVEPGGETASMGRTARRYSLSLSGNASSAAPAPGPADGGSDPDTRRRVDFLEGRTVDVRQKVRQAPVPSTAAA